MKTLFPVLLVLYGFIFLGLWSQGGWALSLNPPSGTKKIVFLDKDNRPLKALEDADADGRFEKQIFYVKGQPSRIETDRNADGRPEEILLLSKDGRARELLLDRNADGRPDKWQFYVRGQVVRVEEDTDFDGRVDLRVELDEHGQPKRLWRDADDDGCFEIEESYPASGERVVSFLRFYPSGVCQKGRVFSRYFYQNGRLCRRIFDQDLDGTFELEEFLSFNGKRCLLIKHLSQGQEAFLYQGSSEPRWGFRDQDADGVFEEKFDYQARKWQKIKPLPLEELISRCRRSP